MIDYRPATSSDAEAVALLHARSWRENYRGAFTDKFLDDDLQSERLLVWSKRLDDPPADQCVLVACERAELVGFVCAYGAHDSEWGSFIDNLHVAPAAKRGGIGRALMRRTGALLVPRYSELGVYLWVLEGNSSARQFYERIGARNAGVTTMETHGGAIVRSCRYTWPRADLLAAV